MPFPEGVDRLAWSEFDEPMFVRPHWFNFNWQNYLGPWDHASIHFYKAGCLKQLFAAGRASDLGQRVLPGIEIEGLNGWHASWFGTDEEVLHKLMSYAHAFDSKDVQALAEGVAGIRRRRDAELDMFGTRRALPDTVRLPLHAHLLEGQKVAGMPRMNTRLA